MLCCLYINILAAFIGMVINNNHFIDAFNVKEEYKEMMAYLVNASEQKAESEIGCLAFHDLLEMQKLITITNLNEKITFEIGQRITNGQCKIDNDKLICNTQQFHPSEYYKGGQSIEKGVCPYIQTLFINNTNRDILSSFGLWDDCIGAAANTLENLYIDLPENSILNAAYITFLKLHKRTFPKLAILSIAGWIDGMVNITELCPGNQLVILILRNFRMDLIQWTEPPAVLQIDATNCPNIDSLHELSKPTRQAWTNPPNVDDFLDTLSHFKELSFSLKKKNEYFYYKYDPYILAGNIEQMIQILTDMNVLREFIPLEHLFIDDLKNDRVDLSVIKNEKTIRYLKIFTSDGLLFEKLIWDEHITDKFKQTFEFALIDVSTKLVKKSFYIDFEENFVESSLHCCNLLETIKDIKYLVLRSDEITSEEEITSELLEALHNREELIFLKLSIKLSHLSGIISRSGPDTFDRATHISAKEIEILSMKCGQHKCVEVIFKASSYMEKQMKDATAAIMNNGDYYHFVFDEFVDEYSIGLLTPIFAEFTDCKYLVISSHLCYVDNFFKYMADNKESLKKTFNGLIKLKFIRLNVLGLDNLNILGKVLQSLEFIVLKFEPGTEVADKTIEFFVNELNEPEIDQQQHNDNNKRNWYQPIGFSNRCKRIYVLSRKSEMDTNDVLDLHQFIEYSESLQDKSNEIITTKKKTYKKIQNLRDETVPAIDESNIEMNTENKRADRMQE